MEFARLTNKLEWWIVPVMIHDCKNQRLRLSQHSGNIQTRAREGAQPRYAVIKIQVNHRNTKIMKEQGKKRKQKSARRRREHASANGSYGKHLIVSLYLLCRCRCLQMQRLLPFQCE